MKKIITALMVSAVVLMTVFMQPAFADEGSVGGISVTPDGTLTWDGFAGAETWWVGVSGSYLPAENGCDLNSMISAPGVYAISVEGFANDNSVRVAVGSATVSFDGKHFANGSFSVLAGWWCPDGDYIKSVSANGTEIMNDGGLLVEPGTEVTVAAETISGYEVTGAFLRYSEENVGYTDFDGGQATFTAPDATWTIGINVRKTTPGFNMHYVDFGRVTENGPMSERTVNVGIRTGSEPLDSSRLKVEWSGDGNAFACQEMAGGIMAEPFELYNFWACPADETAAGEYYAVLTLYYDVLGDGTVWSEIDTCTFRMTVVSPGTPVMMTGWWCTSGDFVTDVKVDGFGMDEMPQLVPGEKAIICVAPSDGYRVTGICLRYLEENHSDGITVNEGSDIFEAEFVVPDNDFAVGIDVEEIERFTVRFEAGEGSGEMPPVTVISGEEMPVPDCAFDAPEGRTFDCWGIIMYDEFVPVHPGDVLIPESNVTLVAMWKTDESTDILTTAADPNDTTAPPDTRETTDRSAEAEKTVNKILYIMLCGIVAVLAVGGATSALIALKKRKGRK